MLWREPNRPFFDVPKRYRYLRGADCPECKRPAGWCELLDRSDEELSLFINEPNHLI
jgi:hypothetical protein